MRHGKSESIRGSWKRKRIKFDEMRWMRNGKLIKNFHFLIIPYIYTSYLSILNTSHEGEDKNMEKFGGKTTSNRLLCCELRLSTGRKSFSKIKIKCLVMDKMISFFHLRFWCGNNMQEDMKGENSIAWNERRITIITISFNSDENRIFNFK